MDSPPHHATAATATTCCCCYCCTYPRGNASTAYISRAAGYVRDTPSVASAAAGGAVAATASGGEALLGQKHMEGRSVKQASLELK
jgi:hypothetical protein